MLKTSSSHEPPQSPQEKFYITAEVLDNFLYGRQNVERVDVQGKLETTNRKRKGSFQDQECSRKVKSLWCEECCKHIQGECPIHSTSPKPTYAIRSFPPEVQLCTSSIPGYKYYGACAARPIPSGTWIGPYEGKRIRACELTENKDNAYIWEIYENSKFSHFIDGSDENIASWMRFIRCARNKNEQNMTVFQYGKNIYYRALRDIAAREEMLIWYDSTYTQFWGIPIALKNENEIGEKGTTQNHSVVAQHSGLHGYHGLPQIPQTKQSPLYPPSQTPQAQPPVHVASAPEAPTPFPREIEQRPPYGQPPPNVQPSHVRSPYGQSPPHVRPPQVRTMYHVPRSFQAPTPFQLPSLSTASAPYHAQSPFTMTPPSSQASSVSQGTPKAHVPPFSMTPYPPRAGPESQGTPFQIPQVPPIPLSSSPPQLSPVYSSPGAATTRPFYRATTEQHERKPIPPSSPPSQLSPVHSSPGAATTRPFYRATTEQHERKPIPPSSPPSQLSPVHSSPGAATTRPFYRATTEQHERKPIPPSSPPSQLSPVHSSPGAATTRPFYRATTDQHERGLLEGTTTKTSSSPEWSSVEVKENMPVNTTEVQFKTSINSQPSVKSSPLQNLSPSIHNTTKSSSEEKTHNQVSSTVEANEEEQISWKCGQCGKNFGQRLTLQMHVCSKVPEKPFQCGHCSLAFTDSCELREHVITHTNDRPFKCGFCGRSFAGATTLNNHMRTHTGEKPFACETCGKTFAIATQLSRHMKLPGIDCAKRQKDARWFNQSAPIAVEL